MTTAEYNQCVDMHADGVYRFVLKNMRDEDAARDVVQDSFEKVWRKAGDIPAEKARSYLYTTAYHTMIDSMRKNRRFVTGEEQDVPEPACSPEYSGLREILEGALQRLPPDQRSVVLLRDYEGYSYQEIGQITGLSEPQVKVYIYRARVFLKKYIGSMDAVV